ncbi:helix-turn-helix domain-containing protein [Staphylococcus equorum]|uniref:Helix-turn-helix domain-containing protein n=1 Tax=Staphylococcus equorum TaxID=246432 RepID=A0A9X4L1L9_9STAP|nr:helix-turn-helix domain-containing protein [Staphylococcus equorum]MDG0818875.1 helix-turn-helix domain-containing protein [Staphylococcus equorum]MDG0839516.1 helix-turn-helix domain-containing protein [Staphylococcus equorum]MDG0844758.1 helix-turn-helix domain-containing protein [Staphylococcus equorum]
MKYEKKDELDYICKMIQENTGMNISISKANITIKEFKFVNRENPFLPTDGLYQELFTENESIFEIPFIKSLNDIECFLCLRTTYFDLTIGPCVLEEVTNSLFYDYIKRYKVPLYLKKNLRIYFNSIPIYKKNDLINMGQLVYFLLFNKQLSPLAIKEQSLNTLILENDIDFELSIKRLNEQLHHDILLENKFNEYIKQGNIDSIKNIFKNTIDLEKVGVVMPDNLTRNDKNLAISAVAIASRSAIEGGLHYEVAYSMSDILIQKIEVEKEIDLLKSVEYIFIEFANQVKKLNSDKYSQPINLVQRYIYNHLYQLLTLDILAKHVNLSSKYLSHLFKKEVGITISAYITEKKLEEAKLWLDNSSLSISEIAHQLSFSDQSYFIKVFKRSIGLTPKQYRLKNYKT